jgi:FMN phosphatase YigB (HAD superfamily)
LERVDEPAAACLFIDDVLVNIEGARKAGLNAVHFQDNEQAIAEIRAVLA